MTMLDPRPIGLWPFFCASMFLGCNNPEQSDKPRTPGEKVAPSESAGSAMRSPFAPSPTNALATETPRPVSKEETAKGEDYSLEVQALQRCRVGPPFAPDEGNIKQGIRVEIAGTGSREVPVNPLYAKLRDDAGNEYRPTLAGCQPVLASGRVKNQDKLSGFITFELPESSRGLVLSYSAFVVGRASQTLEVAIGDPSR